MPSVKCQFCKLGLEKSIAHREATPNGKATYFHSDCYPFFVADQEKKQKNKQEQDNVKEILEQLYKTKVEHDFWIMLQQLINRTNSDWETIKEAYIYCNEAIMNARRTVNFESVKGEMQYGFAIIKDKLPTVKRNIQFTKIKAAKEEVNEAFDESIASHLNQEVEYKPDKKKRNNDISDFVD